MAAGKFLLLRGDKQALAVTTSPPIPVRTVSLCANPKKDAAESQSGLELQREDLL